MGPVYRPLLVTGAGALCLGTYLGGWAITAGHVFLIGGIMATLLPGLGSVRGANSVSATERRFPIRASTWYLMTLTALFLLSILVFWEEYERPLKDGKKLRYYLIPVLCLSVPAVRRCFYRSGLVWAPWLVGILIFSVVVSTAAGIVGYFTNFNPLTLAPPAEEGRASGVYSLVMTYAYSMQFAVLSLLGVAILVAERSFRERRWFLIAVVIGVAVGTIGIYFSFTRGAALGLILGVGVLLLARRAWRGIAIFGVCGAALFGYALSQDVRFVTNQNTSNMLRLSQWRASAIVFAANPLFGVGYRQLEKRMGEFKETYHLPKDDYNESERPPQNWYVGHAHNNFLEAFAATGVLGGLAFVGFCAFWGRETWHSRWGRTIFFPSVAAFVVSGLFENTFYDGEVITMLMLLYVASQIVLDHETSPAAIEQVEPACAVPRGDMATPAKPE